MKIHSPFPRRRTRLEIIPLIDIMFFLLAAFMMVSPQLQKVRVLKAALPVAGLAPMPTKPESISLRVDRNGEVYQDNIRISFDALHSLLADRCTHNPDLQVFVSGDRDTTHGSLVYVLDFVKRAGARRVAIAVDATTNQP